MANLRTLGPRHGFFMLAVLLLSSVQTILSYQYKVGDLDAWGIPTSSHPQVYAQWSRYHTLRIGDSLLFLYPPSQDSVIQVTAQSYNSCNLKDPILYMDNGNSLFNITAEGEYFFTSGKPGHCEKKQKLHILVGNVTASAFTPSYGPTALSDAAPSYPTVFGTIPAPPASSSQSLSFSGFMSAAIGFVVCALLGSDV